MIRRAIPICAALVAAAFWLLPDVAFAQSLSLDLGDEATGTFSARLIQILALMTVISVAPGILLMGTSFLRIVVVLSMLRVALGLQQTPPNMVIIGMSLFLTAYVMGPTFERAWVEGVSPLINETVTEEQAAARTIRPFKDFMLSQVREQDLRLFQNLSDEPSPNAVTPAAPVPGIGPPTATALLGDEADADRIDPPLQVLVPAFIISELRRAFEIGFLLFLPFLIIDMTIASLLMSMGMMMLPPVIISLPFKVIFFVLIEGWYLVSGSLVRSFGTV